MPSTKEQYSGSGSPQRNGSIRPFLLSCSTMIFYRQIQSLRAEALFAARMPALFLQKELAAMNCSTSICCSAVSSLSM